MPKIKPLTKQGREQQKIDDLQKCITTAIRHKKADSDMNAPELAKTLGISTTYLRMWMKGGDAILKASFGAVMLAALRCGVRLEVSLPEQKSVSFSDEEIRSSLTKR